MSSAAALQRPSVANWGVVGFSAASPSCVSPLPSPGPPTSFVFLQIFTNFAQLPAFAPSLTGRSPRRQSRPGATMWAFLHGC